MTFQAQPSLSQKTWPEGSDSETVIAKDATILPWPRMVASQPTPKKAFRLRSYLATAYEPKGRSRTRIMGRYA